MALRFLVYWALLAPCCCVVIDQEYPDISELFPSFAQENIPLEYKGAVVQNITFDIEKLDMTKFRRSMEAVEKQLFNHTDESQDNRRQIPIHGDVIPQWKMAHIHYSKVKALDTMLQLIYMARHKIRELENQPLFNPKDTAYRIGYLYTKIRRIWKRLMDIYSRMHHQRQETERNPEIKRRIMGFLKMHHRAAKLHVQFTYMYWVLVRLHEQYHERTHVRMTSPHTTTEFVATTLDYIVIPKA